MYRIASRLVICLTVALMTAPFVLTVPPVCDPFASVGRTLTQSTCQGSNIEYYVDGSALKMAASLQTCASANPDSTISAFFEQLITPNIDNSINTWTFSYSILWNDPNTNCVVDVTSDDLPSDPSVTPVMSFMLPNDTNGLNNSPLTNISDYALNQWYTRSFVINGSALSSFRVGFTCASQTPGSNVQQVAYVRDITWKSGSNEGTVFKYEPCVYCSNPSPIVGAYCLSFGDDNRWVYEGNINRAEFDVSAPLTVIGNVTTAKLLVNRLLDIRGCLISRRGEDYAAYEQIVIYGFRLHTTEIRQDPTCGWPRFYVLPEYSSPFLNMGVDDILCPDGTAPGARSNGSDITTVTDNSIVISVPNSAFECYQNDYTWITAIIVPVGVGTAGIIIGIVFGVRKCRQVNRAKQLDLEMKRQVNRVDPMGHCPPAQ